MGNPAVWVLSSILSSISGSVSSFVMVNSKGEYLEKVLGMFFFFGLSNVFISPLLAKVVLKKEGTHFWKSTFLLVRPYKLLFPLVAILANMVSNSIVVRSIQVVEEDKTCDISTGVPVATTSFVAGASTLALTFLVYRELPNVIQTVGMCLVLASILCYAEAKYFSECV